MFQRHLVRPYGHSHNYDTYCMSLIVVDLSVGTRLPCQHLSVGGPRCIQAARNFGKPQVLTGTVNPCYLTVPFRHAVCGQTANGWFGLAFTAPNVFSRFVYLVEMEGPGRMTISSTCASAARNKCPISNPLNWIVQWSFYPGQCCEIRGFFLYVVFWCFCFLLLIVGAAPL